ncbi:hypothetical protein VOLCADRAFT_105498 [Volvox carteri f. nagariensis]|uniref:Uncharacterized protein n=1 Tax=Volvox carteri f. nagariensis TaxID=3068 RepID=D8U184_VOLCA|nr:uncharacterized protein VOLCADRAFT_105498 [Volvox carteri f. nagariensis]EFJ46512.1 hypothetical protein VOLCADRAFT_105498 [Volvox carteri f. nagariensis]|eukprot:XP_002952369.1 hypothetical protein VOLCADRAFT_105498 [Volvox carteri f. nagariensis]
MAAIRVRSGAALAPAPAGRVLLEVAVVGATGTDGADDGDSGGDGNGGCSVLLRFSFPAERPLARNAIAAAGALTNAKDVVSELQAGRLTARGSRAAVGAAPTARGTVLADKQPMEPAPGLELKAQLSLPGAVCSIHPLKKVRITGSSGCGAGGSSGGKGAGQSRVDQGCGPRGHDEDDDCNGSSRPAAAVAATFAAVLCGDAARSLVVIRVQCDGRQTARKLWMAAAGRKHTAATAAASMEPSSTTATAACWALQQLLAIPGVHSVLPVSLPSALNIALAPTGSSRGVGAWCDAVLVCPAAVVVLETLEGQLRGVGGADAGWEREERAHDVARHGGAYLYDNQGRITRDDVVAQQDALQEEDDDWGSWGHMYTQRQRPALQRGYEEQYSSQYQHLHQREYQRDRHEHQDLGDGGHPCDEAPAYEGEGSGCAATAGASAAAPSPPFAAGAVTSAVQLDGPLKQARDGVGQPQQIPDGELAGGGGAGRGGEGAGTGGGAREAAMVKVLVHMSRRWDADFQHALEQRAALGRMTHLTAQTERLLADAGQRPQPTFGSSGARPPSRAALLDPLMDLEEELRLLQRREEQLQQPGAAPTGVTRASLEGGVAGGASAAMDRLLDELLGDEQVPVAAETAAAVRGVADRFTVMAASGGSRPGGGSVVASQVMGPAAAAAARTRTVPMLPGAGMKDGGSGGANVNPPETQLTVQDVSWSLVLESITQARHGSDWVLQAVLRLVGGCDDVTVDDGSGDDGAAGAAFRGTGAAPYLTTTTTNANTTTPAASLCGDLDDVALLVYCPAGLPLGNVRARWSVLQGGRRRVVVEAGVPLGDLLGLAAAAAAARAATVAIAAEAVAVIATVAAAAESPCSAVGEKETHHQQHQPQHQTDSKIAAMPRSSSIPGSLLLVTSSPAGRKKGRSSPDVNMCEALRTRLLAIPGFRVPRVGGNRTGAPKPGHCFPAAIPTAGSLVWEGALGWCCVVTLSPYGVYGCEAELSYMGASGGDASSSIALDQVQCYVTEVSELWCEQVGRRLTLLSPNPLVATRLERLEVAGDALQRCVDTTLELLESTLLTQQRQQRHQQQKQQPYATARRSGSASSGLAKARTCVVDAAKGTAAAEAEPASGVCLQDMLQEVQQLQLQLSAAMETLLTS